MSTPNPFFAAQDRLRSLLADSPYFAGLRDDQMLTEKIADLGYQVDHALVPLGFGFVITTSSGKSGVSSYEALNSDEEFNLSIIHNPTLDSGHDALDAQWAAIQAVQGKSVTATPRAAATEKDFFRVTGHQRRGDGPPGCNVREIHVTGCLRLL